MSIHTIDPAAGRQIPVGGLVRCSTGAAGRPTKLVPPELACLPAYTRLLGALARRLPAIAAASGDWSRRRPPSAPAIALHRRPQMETGEIGMTIPAFAFITYLYIRA